jgi:hypothetical protein
MSKEETQKFSGAISLSNVYRGGHDAGWEFLPDKNVRGWYNLPMRRRNRQRPTRAARRKLAVGFQHSALAQRRPAHVQDEQRGDLFISL